MTRPTQKSRVTPPTSDTDVESVAYSDLLSFNRAERRHLASKFDAEFMDLHRYISRALTGKDPDDGRVVEKITTVDGERVAVDDILIEMLWLLRRRTDPEVPIEEFDDLSFLDLAGLLTAPKAGS